MGTRKVLAIMGAVIGSLAAFFVTSVIVIMLWLTADNRTAASPEKIARRAGFSLPAYEVLDYSDNFDRGSSAWSCTEWSLILKRPVSSRLRKRLGVLCVREAHWSYDMSSDTYHCFRIGGRADESPEVHVSVDCRTGTIKMYYTWWDFLS